MESLQRFSGIPVKYHDYLQYSINMLKHFHYRQYCTCLDSIRQYHNENCNTIFFMVELFPKIACASILC